MCVWDKNNVKSRDFIASCADSCSYFEAQRLESPFCPSAGDMESLSGLPMSKRSGDMASSRLKFLCSYGGKMLPRPYDYQLRYAGGETRVLVVNRDISYNEFMRRLRMLAKMDVCVKYKLPHEDLDALVSVVSDEDFQNMVDEYDKIDFWDCSCRLRLFLFPQKQQARCNINEAVADASNSKQRFLEVANGGSSIIKKQKDQLSVQRLQQSPQVSGGLHAVAGSPLRFSTSAADLLAVQPAVLHPPTANFTPAATQTRSLSMAVHPPVHPPVPMKLMGQQYGVPVFDYMPRMQNSKGVVFQQSRRDKPDGSHFQTVLPGLYARAAPSNHARSTANTENKTLEQSQHDAVSPRRRHFQDTINEAVLLNSRSSSYGKAGLEFVDVETSEAEERTKHVMNDNPRQFFQQHKLSRMVKDYSEADLQDHYKLDKSSSGSSSNSSYEFQREMSHSLASTGVSSPSPPHPLQTPWKIAPSTTYDDQLFTSNGAYRDQPPCSNSPGASYCSNFRGTALSRFPAQIDEGLMRQLQQRTFSTELSGKDKITKSHYLTNLNEGEFHSNSPRYEGRAAACEDYYYESHQNMFPAYPVHGLKQHVLYS